LSRSTIKVCINGCGVIGKRVADAVSAQEDMKVVGVSDVVADWRIRLLAERYPIYCSIPDRLKAMEEKVEVAGLLSELLEEVDVVVDCTPAGIGAKNKPVYEKAGVKAIFEGGEKHEVAGRSIVATYNYDESLGAQFTRVVSCNTTAMCRVVGGLHKAFKVKKARIALFRRCCDVWESHKVGCTNTAVPELHVPSHHAPDVKTVIHDLDIVTMAAKGSHNLYHMHMAMIELTKPVSREDVLEVLEEERRVVLVYGEDGIVALNSIFELARDLGRPRGDLYEIPVWGDSVSVEDSEVYMVWACPNESNVIPDNVDAVRALTEAETDWRKSVEATDRALGVLSKLY